MAEEKKAWWKEAVIYQIYPRSFADSNGDGIGDLNGITAHLDYLETLGIDVIWLSPVYKSPNDDNGYDISDYTDIDPMFGCLDDMQRLIEEGKKRGIYMIMDLVLNHSSDEHKWFIEAKKSKDNPYHDYYVWRDGVEGVLPNDMKASFGGSAWEWVPELGQYYFHQFSVKQPDLNWDNPKVRQELFDMIYGWMEKGVGGFRLDVIDQIAKEPDKKITANGPMLHNYIREMSKATFQKGDLITVGETWGATTELAKLYSNPDGSEFSMVFQFEHILLDQQEGKEKWDLAPFPFMKFKQIIKKWQKELYKCGWNSLFWNNHDLPRIVSRWGNDKEYRVESAKMLATLLHGLQGTPYVYQGEELGMTNVKFDIEDYKDIETLNLYKERLEKGYAKEDIMESIYVKGRDNARTPMQWNTSSNAGFTTGIPWLRLNDNYPDVNVAAQEKDTDSVLNYYKKLIALRKSDTYKDIFTYGKTIPVFPEKEMLMAYCREKDDKRILVLGNFGEKKEALHLSAEPKKLLLSNMNRTEIGPDIILAPQESAVVLL